MRSKPAALEQPRTWSSLKPEPDVAHLLPVLLAIVRQHVGDQRAAPRASARARLRRARRPDPARGAAPASASRHRAPHRRSAAPRARRGGSRRSSIAQPPFAPPAASRRTDRRRSRAPTNGASAAADLARAAAQIADDPAFVEQRRAARADANAAPNKSSRSLSHCPAAEAKNSSDLCAGAPGHLSAAARPGRLRPWSDLLAHERPQPPRRRVRRRAPACSSGWWLPGARSTHFASASVFRWRLTVDCGSCRTSHRLRHGQLVPFEQQQHAAAGRIARASERSSKIGFGTRAASIRKSGYMVTRARRPVNPRSAPETDEHRYG